VQNTVLFWFPKHQTNNNSGRIEMREIKVKDYWPLRLAYHTVSSLYSQKKLDAPVVIVSIKIHYTLSHFGQIKISVE
jgi:hypothetical protein